VSKPSPLLFIVTGSRGAGKTTFCQQMVEAAQDAGWKAAGLLSLPVYENSTRTAIDALDLRANETRRLATRNEEPTPGTKHWQFDPEAVHWGNQVLQTAIPCDLLVVDELGPLEFERGGGWQAGVAAISSGQYAIALVVIRAELLGDALLLWDEANLVEIDTPDDSANKARILSEQLF
jgi:nucleoside-triphosphatase